MPDDDRHLVRHPHRSLTGALPRRDPQVQLPHPGIPPGRRPRRLHQHPPSPPVGVLLHPAHDQCVTRLVEAWAQPQPAHQMLRRRKTGYVPDLVGQQRGTVVVHPRQRHQQKRVRALQRLARYPGVQELYLAVKAIQVA